MASWLSRAKALWQRLFFWHTRQAPSEEVRTASTHDHALVLSVQEPEQVTGWKKISFLNHVLSHKEKRLFWGSLASAALLFSVSGWLLASPHLMRVPKDGGILTEALIGSPKLVNPLYASLNDVDQDLSSLIYSGLFRLNDQLEPEPDLAARYEWRENGTVLEIVLRTDARFQDNTPVTADDIVYTYQSIKSPTWKSPLASAFKQVNVIRVDNQTVQFILDKPEPQLLNKLTVGILPAHLWEDAPNPILADLNLRPVGSGPYQISSLRRDQKGTVLSYTLDRSDLYYANKPYITSRVFKFFGDDSQATTAIKEHQVDTFPFVPWKDVANFSQDAVRPLALRLPQQTIAFLNLRDPLLKDAKLRILLSQTIDQEGLAEAIKPSALPGSSPFPFLDIPTSTSTTSTTALSLDQLRNAFDTAGWKIDEQTGIRSYRAAGKTTSSTGTPLILRIDVPNQPDLVKMAEHLRQRWSLIGAKVDIQTHSPGELFRNIVSDRSKHQVVVWNILLSPTQDPAPFWGSDAASGQGFNFSNLTSKPVDDRINAIEAATSSDALRAARIAFAQALATETPAIFLARPTYVYLVSNQIKGTSDMNLATPSDRLIRSSNWWIESTLRWK